jgi:hypothetical protein
MNFDEMKSVLRPMAVLHDGVWQRCEGVWLETDHPLKARVILNGKEFIVDGRTFIDYRGYSEADINLEIIQRNISSLPKLKKKQNPLRGEHTAARLERIMAAEAPAYRIVNRNGRAQAVPWPGPMAEDDNIRRTFEEIIVAEPPRATEPPPTRHTGAAMPEPPRADNV